MNTITPIKATTLTPFSYHSLMVQGGTTTLQGVISDTAIMYGLCSTLGFMRNTVVLPSKDYKRDLLNMPLRASVFTDDNPSLLPPLYRRINLEEEGGYKKQVQDTVKKGNLGAFHQIQEVNIGQIFRGALFGFDIFQYTGLDEVVIRVGLHRNGMIKLERGSVDSVRLNAHTAKLFDCDLDVDRYMLHNIQLTSCLSLPDASNIVSDWR